MFTYSSFAEDIFTKPGLELNQSIKAGDGGGVPIGTVIVWTQEQIPDGWLECKGQAVDPNNYPKLYAMMHVLPNYRGRFLQGTDDINKVGDRLEAGLPNIWGDFTGSNALGIKGGFYQTSVDANFDTGNFGWSSNRVNVAFSAARCSAVYGRSDTVQPPAVVVKYIIKAE